MQKPLAVDLYKQARQALSTRDINRAQMLIGEALECDDRFTNAYRLLADIYAAKGDWQSACAVLERARLQLPAGSGRFLAVTLHLSESLLQSGDIAGASAQLDRDSILALNDIHMLARAGYLYTCCEDHAAALAVYEKSLQLEPKNTQLMYNCAAANRAMGHFARAEQLYERVIELYPKDWEAYRNRSDLRKQTEGENHVAELQALLAKPALSAQAKVQLNFALAKELEDLGRSRESFSFLEYGCRARREVLNYEVTRDCEVMVEVARVFTPERLGAVKAPAEHGEGVILVLGMPRTGTTLVDRILCATSGVVSAGEPDTFGRLLNVQALQNFPNRDLGQSKAELVRATATVDLAAIGAEYIRQMRARAAYLGGNVIIDKNPMNFLYAGLIQAALPAARIVHLRRHPVDTCYAIYKTLFKSAYPFSYEQRELAQYDLGYRELMDHRLQALPQRIYELHYERLVDDLEGESQKLFEFCNLPWAEDILEFYRREKQGTATASAAQVRQPVYRSSVGKWQRYREQLRPLVDTLRAGGIEID